ncbi:MAG: lipopolysaccharide export system permease protein [Gemmatimonadaceae bacterium]|nr:lipopolysaccharide export system permease protein [Gemmatimonadaceae bacterium]
MKILHRYVLKEHVGPLTFALTALTSILLLQYIGKHFGELVGKGLPTLVIAEFFGLSVPLTVALTLPMAVLVSTLYAFSRLAAENEITALKASGVSLVSVLKPVLWAALGVTIVMIFFNDQVLPRSNHKLATLQRDIAQKKPTFGLREQVINEVSPGKFYLRAGHLDEASNMMREVTIYDMSDPTRRRTIFADSGNMGMSKGMTDLELTLYNGNSQDVPTNNPDELQRLYFNVDVIRFRGVGNQFQKTTTDSYKSDREMTVCEMQEAQDRARREHQLARKEFEKTFALLRKAKAKVSKEVLAEDPSEPWDVGIGRLYCAAIASLKPKVAHAQGLPRASAVPPTPPAQGARGQIATAPPVSPEINSQVANIETLRARLDESTRQMNAYGVEIHKKFALAVACFVFVLLGAPIALRFPRGGVGLTIGVSLFVFALYYVCLIVGESLGKRGIMPAVLSMWMANVIFALIALLLLAKMGKEGSTARGGDMREMFDSIRGWVRSKVGRKKPMIQSERAAA